MVTMVTLLVNKVTGRTRRRALMLPVIYAVLIPLGIVIALLMGIFSLALGRERLNERRDR